MAGFEGFSRAGIGLLAALEETNTRPFFKSRRTDYEDGLLAPARTFVEDMGQALREAFHASIHASPKVNKSIRRLARDTRFSADKRPYKTHLDFWFPAGGFDRAHPPGFYLRLFAEGVTLGAGVYVFSRPDLEAYREAVAGEELGVELVKVLDSLESAGYRFGGSSYRRVPAGMDRDHPLEGLLRRKGLVAFVERRLPAAVYTEGFVPWCLDRYEPLFPLSRWLLRVLG